MITVEKLNRWANRFDVFIVVALCLYFVARFAKVEVNPYLRYGLGAVAHLAAVAYAVAWGWLYAKYRREGRRLPLRTLDIFMILMLLHLILFVIYQSVRLIG
jgi:membrane associated rhomboid family serine protease